MRILRWSGRHNLLVHLLPRGNVSTHHSPHSTPRREWQLTPTHIAPVRHLHVLAIIARHAPLHVDQVPLGVDLVHLLLTHAPHRHQQVLHRAVLVAHLTRHLLPLERLARVLRLTHAAHAHLALARGAQRAVRHAHAVRGAEAREAPAAHDALEALALRVREEEEKHLRDALDVDALAGDEVATCDLRA